MRWKVLNFYAIIGYRNLDNLSDFLQVVSEYIQEKLFFFKNWKRFNPNKCDQNCGIKLTWKIFVSQSSKILDLEYIAMRAGPNSNSSELGLAAL